MNTEALLALIADLYAQLGATRAQVVEYEKRLDETPQSPRSDPQS